MFKPAAEAGTGDGPLPCGKRNGLVRAFKGVWSELVFAGSSFGLAESLLLRHQHLFVISILSSQKLGSP